MDEQEDYVMADPPSANSSPVAPTRHSFNLKSLVVAGIIIIVGAMAAYVAIARKPIQNQATFSTPVSQTPTQSVPTLKPDRDKSTSAPIKAAKETAIIYFSFDDAQVTQEQRSRLSSFWSKIRGKTGAIAVEGHTDDLGREDYNIKLSQHRAAEVVKLLKTMGMNNQYQIILKAKGETMPVKDNNTKTGRALNRRVVIYFNTNNYLHKKGVR